MRRAHTLAALLAAAAACRSRAPADPYAPPPFSAERIREGCPAGRTLRFLDEAPGRPPSEETWTFLDCDADGCVLVVAADGRPAARRRATWEELRSHALFPAAATRVSESLASTPAGTFPGRTYTVNRGATVEEYTFADALPGPPVRWVRRKGRTILAGRTLVAHTTPE
jgi:hypothetical protein